MQIEEDRSKDGYIIMSLYLNHQQGEKSLRVLEALTGNAYIGQVDRSVQPVCWITNREAFFHYHTSLANNGVETSDIGGFLTKGLVSFHAYDLDGNRLNFSSM